MKGTPERPDVAAAGPGGDRAHRGAGGRRARRVLQPGRGQQPGLRPRVRHRARSPSSTPARRAEALAWLEPRPRRGHRSRFVDACRARRHVAGLLLRVPLPARWPTALKAAHRPRCRRPPGHRRQGPAHRQAVRRAFPARRTRRCAWRPASLKPPAPCAWPGRRPSPTTSSWSASAAATTRATCGPGPPTCRRAASAARPTWATGCATAPVADRFRRYWELLATDPGGRKDDADGRQDAEEPRAQGRHRGPVAACPADLRDLPDRHHRGLQPPP